MFFRFNSNANQITFMLNQRRSDHEFDYTTVKSNMKKRRLLWLKWFLGHQDLKLPYSNENREVFHLWTELRPSSPIKRMCKWNEIKFYLYRPKSQFSNWALTNLEPGKSNLKNPKKENNNHWRKNPFSYSRRTCNRCPL